MAVGRKSKIADPAFAEQVGNAFANGTSRADMSALFETSERTISKWRRDPRVKIHALRVIEDRVLQVTRKVDGIIAGRLEYAEKMTIAELLAIRKEFLGGALREQVEKADAETIGEGVKWLEDNPEAADQLDALLSGGKIPGALPVEA